MAKDAVRARGYFVLAIAAMTAACGRTPAGRTASHHFASARVAELLDADRRYAEQARSDPMAAFEAMLDERVMMPTRDGFARGQRATIEALWRRALAGSSGAVWAPIRGGISADGLHGFTFGYMTIARNDSAPGAAKYLAYWIRQAERWRVRAYRLAPRSPGAVAAASMEPSLPDRWRAPSTGDASMDAHRRSLIAAEKAFSDRAQEIGLGPAFVERGHADAVNMGGPDSPAFIVGSAAIGQAVSGGRMGPPSPVYWSADTALVASTGDLGVTFGVIREHGAPSGSGGIPFFTIWRRDRAGWRYIAE